MAEYLYQSSHHPYDASTTWPTEPIKAVIGSTEYHIVDDGAQDSEFYEFLNLDDELCCSLSTPTLLKPSENGAINQYPTIGMSPPSTYAESTDISSSSRVSSSSNTFSTPGSLEIWRPLSPSHREPELQQEVTTIGGKQRKCGSWGMQRKRCRCLGPECLQHEITPTAFPNSERKLKDLSPEMTYLSSQDAWLVSVSSMLPVVPNLSVSSAPSWDSSTSSFSVPSLASGSSATSSWKSSRKIIFPSQERLQTSEIKKETSPVVDQLEVSRASSTTTSITVDGSDAKNLDVLFDSTLLFRTKGFINRADVDFNISQCSTDPETNSPSSASPSDSNRSANRTTVTPASSIDSNGKRKLLDMGKENSDDNENGDDHNKRQKPPDKALASVLDQKLSCPFRKYSPTKYRLGNTRYATCATGSWKDISHLKDSHIYRVHLAQCVGCKRLGPPLFASAISQMLPRHAGAR